MSRIQKYITRLEKVGLIKTDLKNQRLSENVEQTTFKHEYGGNRFLITISPILTELYMDKGNAGNPDDFTLVSMTLGCTYDEKHLLKTMRNIRLSERIVVEESQEDEKTMSNEDTESSLH